jgi:hypothetical protein
MKIRVEARGQGTFAGDKLISGIKRHICVDTNGLPHMIHVTTANFTDRLPSRRELHPFAVKPTKTGIQSDPPQGEYMPSRLSERINLRVFETRRRAALDSLSPE